MVRDDDGNGTVSESNNANHGLDNLSGNTRGVERGHTIPQTVSQ